MSTQRVINIRSYKRHRWTRTKFTENVFVHMLTESDSHFSLFKFVSGLGFFFPPCKHLDGWFLCMQVNFFFLGECVSMCNCINLHGILSIQASMCGCAKCWLISPCHTCIHTHIPVMWEHSLMGIQNHTHSLSPFLLSFFYPSVQEVQSPPFFRWAFCIQKLQFLIPTGCTSMVQSMNTVKSLSAKSSYVK